MQPRGLPATARLKFKAKIFTKFFGILVPRKHRRRGYKPKNFYKIFGYLAKCPKRALCSRYPKMALKSAVFGTGFFYGVAGFLFFKKRPGGCPSFFFSGWGLFRSFIMIVLFGLRANARVWLGYPRLHRKWFSPKI